MVMRCHYEVIGVDPAASEDDIRRAFRKKALATHPDKNPDRFEEATKEFQLLQEAYAVLSDPQERAWYDNHRDSILHGKDGEPFTEGIDVMEFFSPSAYSGFSNDPEGFYGVYADLFVRIIQDEAEQDDDDDEDAYPKFGDSDSDYETVVRPFYTFWVNFTTKHAFHSADKYDLREADGRQVRRAMEKENKKERDSQRKEYNQTIRELATFLRKRDRRVSAYLAKQKEREEEAERQKEIRKKTQAQRLAELRREHANSEEQQRMRQEMEAEMRELDLRVKKDYGDDSDSQEDGDDIECVACNKTFRNEKSWENHQRSKRHQKAVADLRAQLIAEGGEDDDEDLPGDTPDEEDENETSHPNEDEPTKLEHSSDRLEKSAAEEKSADESSGEEAAKPIPGKSKKTNKEPQKTGKSTKAESDASSDEEPAAGSGISKAELKKANRAKRQAKREAKKEQAKQAASVPAPRVLDSDDEGGRGRRKGRKK